MLSRSLFLLSYIGFWLAYYVAGRIVFLLYQWNATSQLDGGLVRGALIHGLRMDVAVACSLTLIPLCLVARATFIPLKTVRRIVTAYTVGALVAATLAIVADLEIFSVWGYRLDVSPIGYLVTPREAVASASAAPLLLLATILVAFVTAGFLVYRQVLAPRLTRFLPITQRRSLLLLVIAVPLLIVGGRGGMVSWRIGMTAGTVYFSRDNFANQAAINPVWNLAASAVTGLKEQSVDRYTDHPVAKAIVDSLISHAGHQGEATPPMLLKDRPEKIILLFWEGLTAKIVEPLGGRPGITPKFTRLYRDGILFDNVYAAGPRTTMGLVASLSGFPAHPRTKVLYSAHRTVALPSVAATMQQAGYRTGFYYGGPLEFDNRNRYFFRGHYDEIVEKRDYDPRTWNSPWGVHDEILLDRLFRAVDTATSPIFAVSLTLSSHEPYGVPATTRVPGKDFEHRFLNAHAYTDDAVSRFVERARNSAWWGKTLLIIVADHGSMYPSVGLPIAGAPERFRIPMLWLGGALSVRDTVISRIGSQTDIPSTLLAQLGIAASDFPWGRDFLGSRGAEFAFYSFRDGFGFVDRSGIYVFDNVGESVVYRRGNPTEASFVAGRAMQQVVMQEYLDLAIPPVGH